MDTLSLFGLVGKKALVTGGAIGMGRMHALALAGAGADVAIVDIDERCGRSVAKEIEALGRKGVFVKCDICKEDQLDAMIETIISMLGRLDIAINNAGINFFAPAETMKKESWDRIIGFNLTGTFLCCQSEARQMIKQSPMGGKIINIASTSARITNSPASYNASKAGVVQMSRSLASEWAKYNIYVNCISPTYIICRGHAHFPEKARDLIRKMTPLGWYGRPEDVIGASIFLASKASDYITGQEIIIDGGHSLNVWLGPVARVAPVKVRRDEESLQLRHDLDVLGIPHDEDGYNAGLAPKNESDFLDFIKFAKE